MSGRHRAPRARRYDGRHRAPVRHTGMVSVAGVILIAAAGGISASYALTRQSPGRDAGAAPTATVPARPSPKSSALSTSPTATAASPHVTSGRSRQGSDRHPGNSARRPRRTPRSGGPSLVLRTLGGPCWVGVTEDGRQLVARTLPPHHRLAVVARHGRVTLGNSGAVLVQIDHRRPHLAGRPGQVTSFRF